MKHDKSVNILNKSTTTKNKIGEKVTNYDVLKTIKTSSQPYSSELLNKEYGIVAINPLMLITYDNVDLEGISTVEYNNKKYKILKCFEYEKHTEIIIEKVI